MTGVPNLKLKAWRMARGLKMEDAAARVIVDGEPCSKVTWHGWESRGKIPKQAYMLALCDLTGLEPNDFYPRPDGGVHKRATETGGANGGSAPKSGPMGGNGEPPQMALAL
jgi:transcriptional regulator with XRE-family HTH domain